MSTKIRVIMAVWLAFGCFEADAQFRRRYQLYEIQVGVGAANVFGDLGGAATRENWGGLKDIQFSQTRPTFYVAGRTDLNEQFSVKLNVFAGGTAGSDKGSVNTERNYSYSGWLCELSGQAEWNFLRSNKSLGRLLAQKGGLRGTRMQTRAYAFVGAGVVYANPTLETHGQLNDVERTKNSTFGLAVPYGLGVKSDLSPDWAVGFEIGRRYCTSDYLDGLTTDFSKSTDLYYFTTIHAIYKVNFAGGRRRPPRRK